MERQEFGAGNNGLVATEDFQAGDILMYIPREIIITLDEAENSKLFDRLVQKKVLKKLSFTHENLLFKMFLMEQRQQPDALYQNYFKTLPSTWDNFPVHYSDSDMIELDGSFFGKHVRDFARAMSREYITLQSKLSEFSQIYTYDDFLEAFFILQSRFFMVPIESQKIVEQMLVPYADLINHSNIPNATYEYAEEDGRRGVVIRATADITAG